MVVLLAYTFYNKMSINIIIYPFYSFTLYIPTTNPKPFSLTPFTLFTHLLSASLPPTPSHSHLPLLLYLLIYSPHPFHQPKAILIYPFYSIYSFTHHILPTQIHSIYPFYCIYSFTLHYTSHLNVNLLPFEISPFTPFTISTPFTLCYQPTSICTAI